MKWEKIGRIVEPHAEIEWLATAAGAAFAYFPDDQDIVSLYITGRDSKNRSCIGIVRFDMSKLAIVDIWPQAVLELGQRGTFDENGTSYPALLDTDDGLLMYYTGWTQSMHVPFQNDLGLSKSKDGLSFQRVSKAPIMPRNNDDFLFIGSCFVAREDHLWRIWYTCCKRWGERPDEPQHFYHIKYAESSNGIDWERHNKIAVTFEDPSEYVIAKPCVRKINGRYHMWYCYRGDAYRIGYAVSEDGKSWSRRDADAGIECGAQGWDSEMICYPHCFHYRDRLYMLYNGNGYGKSGLGLAVLSSDLSLL